MWTVNHCVEAGPIRRRKTAVLLGGACLRPSAVRTYTHKAPLRDVG